MASTAAMVCPSCVAAEEVKVDDRDVASAVEELLLLLLLLPTKTLITELKFTRAVSEVVFDEVWLAAAAAC